MQLVVLANDSQVEELLNNRGNNQLKLTVIKTVEDAAMHKDADG